MSAMAQEPQTGGADVLDALQQVIQDLHQLIAELPDPKHTSVATQCLLALTKVQQDYMAQSQGGGAMRAQLGAG